MVRFDTCYHQPDVRNLPLDDISSVREIVTKALEKNLGTNMVLNVILSLNGQVTLLEVIQISRENTCKTVLSCVYTC
jgi:hypothetical protein